MMQGDDSGEPAGGEAPRPIPPMMTCAELAERWRVSVRTLDRWRAARIDPAWLRINGRILYPRREVLAFERARLRRPKR